MTDREDAIDANAQGPRHVEEDGTVVEQHSLQDQIAADRYLSGKAAMSTASRGLRFNVVKPGGAAGCSRG